MCACVTINPNLLDVLGDFFIPDSPCFISSQIIVKFCESDRAVESGVERHWVGCDVHFVSVAGHLEQALHA